MRMRFRLAMAKHLGHELTPERAAQIERELFLDEDQSHSPESFGSAQYKGLTFQVESFRKVCDELHPLHVAHWQETEKFRHGLTLNPNYAYYAEIERQGKLLQFTARDGSGELVGNIRVYLYQDMHTQQPGAKEDTLFLLPRARGGFSAVRFIQFVLHCLRLIGVKDAYTDSKILFDENGNQVHDLGGLMRYAGFRHVANVYHTIL